MEGVEGLVFELYDQTDIPDNIKDELAGMIENRDSYMMQIPVPGYQVYRKQLDMTSENVGIMYGIIRDEQTLQGYARLEYRTSSMNDTSFATLSIGIGDQEHRKRIGSWLIDAIIHARPEQIATIKLSLRDDDPLNDHMKSKNYEPKHENILNVAQIRNCQFDLEVEMAKTLKRVSKYENFRVEIHTHESYPKQDEDFASLMETIWNENIGMNTNLQREEFPVERLQGRFEWVRDQGNRIYAVIAKIGDEYVGFTEVFVNNQSKTVGNQSLTGVDPEYRGGGIGYLVKLYMLGLLLDETEVEYWSTFNASQNPGVRRINEKLGFKPHVKYQVYELQNLPNKN